MILLDTHIWIWWATSPERLNAGQLSALRSESAAVSAISFWELAMLAAKGRIELDEPLPDWIDHNLNAFGITTVEITPTIAYTANNLRDLEHRDPADRMILATALEHSLTLLTIDRVLLAYPHVKSL